VTAEAKQKAAVSIYQCCEKNTQEWNDKVFGGFQWSYYTGPLMDFASVSTRSFKPEAIRYLPTVNGSMIVRHTSGDQKPLDNIQPIPIDMSAHPPKAKKKKREEVAVESEADTAG